MFKKLSISIVAITAALLSVSVSAQTVSNYPAKPIIDRMHAEIKRIAALPDVKERLVTLGAEPSCMTPEQFAQWVKTEIPAMAKIVKDEKITVE